MAVNASMSVGFSQITGSYSFDSCLPTAFLSTPSTNVKRMSDPPAVQYVWSRQLQVLCDQLPANRQRSSLVHGLHHAVGLLGLPSVAILQPDLSLGSPHQLTCYHTEQYIGMSATAVLSPLIMLQTLCLVWTTDTTRMTG